MDTAMQTSVVIRRSSPAVGRGLFAALPIRKSAFIAEYTGERITTAVADKHPSRYLFELDDNWTINGVTPHNIAGYINHACEPNAEAEIEDDHINVYALRTIEAGEEITMDYGEEYFDEFIKPVGCKCMSCKE